VQSGGCAGYFGPIRSTSGISLTLSSSAGSLHHISFWLFFDGGRPSSADFNWDGGAAELSLVDMAASNAYVRYDFQLMASSAATSISFTFRDDVGFAFLDSVVVEAALAPGGPPEPDSSLLAALTLGGACISARRRRRSH